MKTQNIISQTARVINSLNGTTPKTMMMVSRETGIERANICWYFRDLRNEGRLFPVYRALCKITDARATFWTMNANVLFTYFINRTQLFWEKLYSDDQLSLLEVIKNYCLCGFKNDSITVSDSIKDVWLQSVKPLIDREAIR